jgi:hypothetical protein
MAQEIECLPSKCKALSSNPSAIKNHLGDKSVEQQKSNFKKRRTCPTVSQALSHLIYFSMLMFSYILKTFYDGKSHKRRKIAQNLKLRCQDRIPSEGIRKESFPRSF